MKLFKLLKNIKCRVVGSVLINITGLYHKDTEVKEGGLFFCLRGTNVDGNNFIKSATANGAKAIVTEQEIYGLKSVTQIIVKNAREAMSLISCNFFICPASKLKIIGVTGTNGKTTISTLIFKSLNNLGEKCALIGTNGIIIGNKKYDTKMTTPDPIELQKYFAMMVKNNIKYVSMEVSAHAIFLHKLDGFKFEQMIFTNLSEDHLDYFKTMGNYFKTKASIFEQKHTNLAIINTDDFYGNEIIKSIKIPYLTYSINENTENKTKVLSQKNANLTANNIKFNEKMTTFNISSDNLKSNNTTLVKTNLIGKFNVSNTLAVILSLKSLGFDTNKVTKTLAQIPPVDGRFNIYFVKNKTIVIDYAHTPDGLKCSLLTCKEITNGKIICVFGCGGNREKEKRKLMGEIASDFADFVIVTSDNPRYEDKNEIASEIVSGITNKKYKIITDRTEAIKYAISNFDSGDLILIAGKGCENYIEENGVFLPYSDYDVIKRLK